jgi:hypothetical protein
MYYNVGNYKKGWFLQAQRNHSLFYTPISDIETTNHNIDWDDFKSFYVFIIFLLELEAFAVETYTNLSKFLVS